MNQRWKYNLDITVTAAFLTKFLIWKAWNWSFYWGLVLAIERNTYRERQLITNTKRETWRYQIQFKLKTEKRGQITENWKLKHTKGSLSISLTNLYATKLILQSKQKVRVDLSKVTCENTKATWADPTQMY